MSDETIVLTMTAKEVLVRLKEMDKHINSKIEQLEQLRTIATSCTVSTEKENVQSSGSQDKLGAIVAKIVDLQNEINASTDQFVNIRQAAKELIFQIENEKEQNVMYDYYMLRLKLWQIAEEYDITYENCRYYLQKGQKTFEEKYNEKYRK